MSDIQCLALTNGTELMGQVEATATGYIIEDPAQVVMTQGQSGQMSYALVPWLPYGENTKYTINEKHVLVTFKPTVEMINYYNRVFGSGIQIAQSSIVTK